MTPFIRVARFDDYAAIAAITRAHAMPMRNEREWREMWTGYPCWARLAERWTIGWVLDDGRGRIVGFILSVPSLYRFRGRDLLCANGRAWAVLPEYRGIALWLMDEHLNQPGVDLFVLRVGPPVSATAEHLSHRVPIGDWEQVPYWVVDYRRFAQTVLRNKRVPLADLLAVPAAALLSLEDFVAGRALPSGDASVAIEAVRDFDSRFDAFWDELVHGRPETLLEMRDRAILTWIYAAPLRRGRVRIFTASRAGLLRAYGIFITVDEPEENRRLMKLADYQSVDAGTDYLHGLIRAALDECPATGASVLEYWGAGVPKTRSLDAYAPYRSGLSCWPFYYRTNDAALAIELARPEVWDPSMFDGQAPLE
jgi:hypothetical protein